VMNASFQTSSSTTATSQIGYAGYVADWETGFYQVRNRFLHPKLGRWVTREPFEYLDGKNLYSYVQGDPISSTDPTGLAKSRIRCLCERWYAGGEGEGERYWLEGGKCYNKECLIQACERFLKCLLGKAAHFGVQGFICVVCCAPFALTGIGYPLCLKVCLGADIVKMGVDFKICNNDYQGARRRCEVDMKYCLE